MIDKQFIDEWMLRLQESFFRRFLGGEDAAVGPSPCEVVREMLAALGHQIEGD